MQYCMFVVVSSCLVAVNLHAYTPVLCMLLVMIIIIYRRSS